MDYDIIKKVELLMKNYQFDEGTALAYVRSEGKCVYCGEDILASLLGYLSAEKEHLLPKSQYPKVEYNNNNYVLSCRACNALKGRAIIENLKWDPVEAIEEHKSELIEKYKELISEKRRNRENEMIGIREIIRTKVIIE